MTAHAWVKPKWSCRDICNRCGLVALRNPLTAWCIKAGCYYDEHPAYKTMVSLLVRNPLTS